jgi:ATP-binding cassette subfamily B protein
LTSPHNNRDTPGRDRGRPAVTAAEKAQAREVSLRRIGRLFGPHRWQLAIVTALIVASSLVGLARRSCYAP